MDTHLKIRFWGVRGTLPMPGEQTILYGGNTSCISLELPNNELIIFDAGSGLKSAGTAMLNGLLPYKQAKLFISHAHWDHINAIPFFAPIYTYPFEFALYGPNQDGHGIKQLISDQMNGIYFPVTIQEFKARVEYNDLLEEDLSFADYRIRTHQLHHPGRCLGYRVEWDNLSFCYVTDNEIYPTHFKQYGSYDFKALGEFVRDCDVLVTDCTYTDEEYNSKVGWGHSSVSSVVDLAHQYNCRNLCLFHHDPDQTDDDIDNKLLAAQSRLEGLNSSVVCLAPKQGTLFELSSKGFSEQLESVIAA